MSTADENPQTKTCPRCGRALPLTEFHRRGKRRQTECPQCLGDRRRLNRLKKRHAIVRELLHVAGQSRPPRLSVALATAQRRLGGPARFGALLADVFMEIVEHGTTSAKLNLFRAYHQFIAFADLERLAAEEGQVEAQRMLDKLIRR